MPGLKPGLKNVGTGSGATTGVSMGKTGCCAAAAVDNDGHTEMINPEDVRDELILAMENSNSFANVMIWAITMLAMLLQTQSQMELGPLFAVARNSRELVGSIEFGDDSTLEDVSEVKDIYDWILALHTHVASVDWITEDNYITAQDAAAKGMVAPAYAANRVYWSGSERKYVIPDWMQQYVVKQRSWVVSGWQLAQERAGVRLCDSQGGATLTGRRVVGNTDPRLMNRSDTGMASLGTRYDVGGCPRYNSACDAETSSGGSIDGCVCLGAGEQEPSWDSCATKDQGGGTHSIADCLYKPEDDGTERFFLFDRNNRGLEPNAWPIGADSTVFKCFVESEDDVLMDEKVFAALRPRSYWEHLYKMEPIWFPAYLQKPNLDAYIVSYSAGAFEKMALATDKAVQYTLQGFNDIATGTVPNIMSLDQFLPQMGQRIVERLSSSSGLEEFIALVAKRFRFNLSAAYTETGAVVQSDSCKQLLNSPPSSSFEGSLGVLFALENAAALTADIDEMLERANKGASLKQAVLDQVASLNLPVDSETVVYTAKYEELLYGTLAALLLLPPLPGAPERAAYLEQVKLPFLRREANAGIRKVFAPSLADELLPDWFMTEDRYDLDATHAQPVTTAQVQIRQGCRDQLDAVGDLIAKFSGWEPMAGIADALRKDMVEALIQEERVYLAKSFSGPTCTLKECRDSAHPADGALQGTRELTRDSVQWESGVYQRWFAYTDEPDYWADQFKFMDTHGWIDEGTTSVETSMILYSPRQDVFSVNTVTFEIDSEGGVSAGTETRVVKLSDKRVGKLKPPGTYWYRPLEDFNVWSLLPVWMLFHLAGYLLLLVMEVVAVFCKSNIDSIVPDDPTTPDLDVYLWCRSTICPWLVEKVKLSKSLQYNNMNIWAAPGDRESLSDEGVKRVLGSKIRLPCTLARIFKYESDCMLLPTRLSVFCLFTMYWWAETAWASYQSIIEERDEMCIDNPAHRSYPGCYTISVPPNPGRDETDLIMDTVQGLSDAADIYQDYRNKMAFCTAITFLHVCIFLDSVPGICRFITMLKKAAIPSIIFIFFFAFIDVGLCAVINLLVGDSLAEFSSLKGSISISINILGGEYPFLESMEELPESKGIIVVVWFWIYLVLMVFVFLNVFITILGEAYEDAAGVERTRSYLSYHPLCFSWQLTDRAAKSVQAINQLLSTGECAGFKTTDILLKAPDRSGQKMSDLTYQEYEEQVREMNGRSANYVACIPRCELEQLLRHKFGCLIGSWWTGSAVDMGIVEEVPDPTDVKVYADPNSTAAKKAAASASDHVLLAQLVSQVTKQQGLLHDMKVDMAVLKFNMASFESEKLLSQTLAAGHHTPKAEPVQARRKITLDEMSNAL